MKIIVGLGNPGEKYEGTRHNLGFRVVEELVSGIKDHVSWEESKKFKAQIVKTSDIIFMKPLTYMNNSGLAVRTLSSYYKILPADIIVIHDELDLPLGKIKVRVGGSAAGHHGVESIIETLGDDKFARVRLGIGNLRTQRSERDGGRTDVENYVLESFEAAEKPAVKRVIKQAVKALEIILEKGEEAAQNQFN